MVHVERTFVVSTPMDVVVGYLEDFAHTEQWDPGTQTCERTDAGEIRVGSTWHNVSQFRGRQTELDYELVRRDSDRLTFVGRNRTATSTDDLSMRPEGSGTSITYRATVEFHGLAKLATPLMQRVFNGLADDTVSRMTTVLGGLRP